MSRELTEDERYERLTPNQRQQPRTFALREGGIEARISRADERTESATIRGREDAATLAAREQFTTRLDHIERELNELYKHARGHRLMSHRQYARIRRALIGARSDHPGRLTD